MYKKTRTAACSGLFVQLIRMIEKINSSKEFSFPEAAHTLLNKRRKTDAASWIQKTKKQILVCLPGGRCIDVGLGDFFKRVRWQDKCKLLSAGYGTMASDGCLWMEAGSVHWKKLFSCGSRSCLRRGDGGACGGIGCDLVGKTQQKLWKLYKSMASGWK